MNSIQLNIPRSGISLCLLAGALLAACTGTAIGPNGGDPALTAANPSPERNLEQLPAEGSLTARLTASPSRPGHQNLHLAVDYRPAGTGFRTQALDCPSLLYFKISVAGSGMPAALYPAQADSQQMIPAGRTCAFGADIPDVPYGATRIAEVTAYDSLRQEIPGTGVGAVFRLAETPVSVTISSNTTPAERIMRQVLQQSDPYLADYMASQIDLTALGNFVGGLAVEMGHANHLDPAAIATDLIAANGDVGLLDPATPAYRVAPATFNGSLSGIGGVDKVDVQITDSSSSLRRSLGNGPFSVGNLTPGSWKLKLNSLQYIFASVPDPVVFSSGQSGASVSLPVVPSVNLLWSFAAPGSLSSPVVAADGSIYLGCSDGKVYALDANGGSKAGFSFAAVGAINSTPALSADGSRLYVGSDDGKIYAVDTATGAVAWSYATGAAVRSAPALDSLGNVYAGSNDSKLYSLDSGGALRAGFPVLTGGAIAASPAIDGSNRIFVQSQDGSLYGLTTAGAALPGFPVSVGVSGTSPALGDGTVYTTTSDLKAINTATGALRWSSTLCRTNAVLDPDGQVLCANAGGNYTLLRAEPATGAAVSIFALPASYIHQAAVGSEGITYFGADDGKFYALNPDYSQKWVYDNGGIISSSPAVVANGIVYVSSSDNVLYALQSGVSAGNPPIQALASGWARFKGNNAGNGRR